MTKILIVVSFILLIATSSFAQQKNSCNVLLEEISGSYKGDCKDGLAHGKGVAKGIDTYSGKFKDGLPDGKGKYTYQNGNVFSGSFRRGLKNGEGKFVYSLADKAYIQKGYWLNGDFVGLSDPEAYYRVILQTGIDNLVIKKLDNDEVKLKISFVAPITKYVPNNLKISSTTGQQSQLGKDFIIFNYSESNYFEIQYSIIRAGQKMNCRLDFEILKTGSYEIIITNE